jgi:hypothetical protein
LGRIQISIGINAGVALFMRRATPEQEIAGQCSAELIAEAKRNLEKQGVENLL